MSGYNEPDKISGHAAAVQEQTRGHWADFAVGTHVTVTIGPVVIAGVVVGSYPTTHCRVILVEDNPGKRPWQVDAARVKIRRTK